MPTPYPVIWARELPDGFVVQGIYDYPRSRDALVIGELRGDVWLSGAAVSRDEGHDHALVRFDAGEGLQVWATGATAAVVGLGFDDGGRTIWIAEDRGEHVHLARLDGATGARTLELPVGAPLPGSAPIVSETMASIVRNSTKQRSMAIAFLEEDNSVSRLGDGGLLVVGEKSIQVVEPTMEIRWSVEYLTPLFVMETESGNLAAQWAAPDGAVYAGVLSTRDGSIVWETPTEASYNAVTPPWVSIVDDAFVLVTNGVGPTTVTMVDMTGTLRRADDIQTIDSLDASELYAIRTRDGVRELIKLGPCPVEQCVVEAL